MQQKHLLTRAKALRNNSTPFEVMLWNQLKSARLGGHKFRRQHVIDHAIVDFFCPAKSLIVEVDGDTHDAAKDAIRDHRHAEMGFETIRFTNADIGKNMAGVIEALLARLTTLPDRWNGPLPRPGSAMPSPPSPEGEGM